MKKAHGADKMNKEQSGLIRVKNMLNSTISMSYPDVVIACIEHKAVPGSIQSNWGSVGEAR